MITQLQSELAVHLSRRQLERKFKVTKIKLQKKARARVRKVRSLSLAWYRRQYFFTSAYRDTKGYIARNEDIFIAMAIIATVLIYGFATTASNLIYLFFQSAFLVADLSHISLALLSIMMIGVPALLSAWLLAFISNTFSFTLMDSATRKQYRSIRFTLRRSLRLTSRFTIAWIELLLAATAPVGLIAMTVMLWVHFASSTPSLLLKVVPLLIGMGGAWVLLCMAHFGLLPYVALFEERKSLNEQLKRSLQLVQKRGRIFLTFFYVISGTILASLSFSSYFMGTNGAVVAVIFGLVGILFANMILVAFYQKRRLARSR